MYQLKSQGQYEWTCNETFPAKTQNDTPHLVCLVLCCAIWTASHFVDAKPTYRAVHDEKGPWAVHIVEIDRADASYRLAAALGGETVYGREPLDETVQRLTRQGRTVAAALNADFFEMRNRPFDGDPDGLCVIDGELVSEPMERAAFLMLKDGSFRIEQMRFSANLHLDGQSRRIDGVNEACGDNGLVLYTSRFDDASRPYASAVQLLAGPMEAPLQLGDSPALKVEAVLTGQGAFALTDGSAALAGRGNGAAFLKQAAVGDAVRWECALAPAVEGVADAVGGAVILVKEGRAADLLKEGSAPGFSDRFVKARHPRSAVGYNAETVFLVAVDGRQPEYSVGMSLPELAELMISLGAEEALNLDGGGSTTLWAEGKVQNRPSDGFPRPIANSLALYRMPTSP